MNPHKTKGLLALPVLALALLTLADGQHSVSGRTDDRAVPGTLPLEELLERLARPDAHEPLTLEAPLGLSAEAVNRSPEPLTPALVDLGQQLYFDKRLSRDGTVSCATCHDPAKGWADAAPVSTGIHGQKGGRSAPTIINRSLGRTQFWDGRAATVEEQALGPIANPVEMGFTLEEAVERLAGIEGYRVQFEAVFGRPVQAEDLGRAIGAFERTILSGASKNDHYEAALPFFDYELEGDEEPEFLERMERALDLEATHRMSLAAERGRELYFGKAACSQCHVGADLTDEDFHNIGIGYDEAGEAQDLGRVAVTGDPAHTGAFRTPTLRNIALTAPYMHDGSLATLMEVVEHYDRGGTPNAHLSEKMFPLELTEQERQDLVTFLEEALTGTITEVQVPRLP